MFFFELVLTKVTYICLVLNWLWVQSLPLTQSWGSILPLLVDEFPPWFPFLSGSDVLSCNSAFSILFPIPILQLLLTTEFTIVTSSFIVTWFIITESLIDTFLPIFTSLPMQLVWILTLMSFSLRSSQKLDLMMLFLLNSLMILSSASLVLPEPLKETTEFLWSSWENLIRTFSSSSFSLAYAGWS